MHRRGRKLHPPVDVLLTQPKQSGYSASFICISISAGENGISDQVVSLEFVSGRFVLLNLLQGATINATCKLVPTQDVFSQTDVNRRRDRQTADIDGFRDSTIRCTGVRSSSSRGRVLLAGHTDGFVGVFSC